MIINIFNVDTIKFKAVFNFFGELKMKWCNKYIWSRKSEFAGVWEIKVYDDNNAYVKNNYVEMKHDKCSGSVEGRIIRTFPKNQTERRWFFRGTLLNEKLSFCFYSEDGIKSEGGGLAILVSDFCFEGRYVSNKNSGFIISKLTVKKITNKEREINIKKKIKSTFKKEK